MDIAALSQRARRIFWHEPDIWYYGVFAVLPGFWPALLIIVWQFRPSMLTIEQMFGVVSATGLITVARYQFAAADTSVITYQQTLLTLLALGLFTLLLVVGGTIARLGILVWVAERDRELEESEQRQAATAAPEQSREIAAAVTPEQAAAATDGESPARPLTVETTPESPSQPLSLPELIPVVDLSVPSPPPLARNVLLDDGGLGVAAAHFWSILRLDAALWAPAYGAVMLLSILLGNLTSSGNVLPPASGQPVTASIVIAADLIVSLLVMLVLPVAETTLILHHTSVRTALRVAFRQLRRQGSKLFSLVIMQISTFSLVISIIVPAVIYFLFILSAAESRSSAAVNAVFIFVAPPLAILALVAWSLGKGWMLTLWPLTQRHLLREGIEQALQDMARGAQPVPRTTAGCLASLAALVGIAAAVWVGLWVFQSAMLDPFERIANIVLDGVSQIVS